MLTVFLLAQSLTLSLPAQASVITVAPSAATGSSAGCSLTDAVLAANASTDAAAGNVTVGACTPTGTPGSGGNGYGSGNVIELAAGSYTFTAANNYWYGPNALPPIASNIVIVGAVAGSVIERSTASGTSAFRLFYVGGGESLASYNAGNVASGKLPGPGQLTLVNLTVENGLAKGGDSIYGGGGLGAGGAVYNQGTLTLTGATLRRNEALGGSALTGGYGSAGGISGTGAAALPYGGGFTTPLWPSSSAASGTFGNGGGIGSNCTTSGCTAGPGQTGGVGGGGGNGGNDSSNGGTGTPGAGGAGGFGGGGAHGGQGTTTIENSNGGPGGFGGGGGGTGTSFASTYNGGAGGFGGGRGGTGYGGGGAGFGGAVFNEGGTVTALNSTLNSNIADGGGASNGGGNGGDGYGGALFNLNGTVVLRYSTLADNAVIGGTVTYAGASPGLAAGGAVYNLYLASPGSPAADAASSATMTVNSSILSGSTNGSTAESDCENNAATFTSGYDVVQTPGTCTFNNNDQNANPQLATSAATANGGPTPTLALTSASPAINHGDTGTTLGPVPTADQRGYGRDTKPDAGAYEYIFAPTVSGLPATLTVTLGNSVPRQSFSLDGSPPLTVTAASSDAMLLPASGITLSSGCGSDTSHYACTLSLTPASNQTGTTTVTVKAADSHANTGQQSMTLTVKAVPSVSLSPTPLAFGSVTAGSSKTLPEVLTNTGTASLSISSISIGGTNAARFTQVNPCGSSLGVGATCTIQVTYKPNALTTDNATLNVASNAPTSPDSVTLSGTGTDTAPTASNASFSTSINTAYSGQLQATNPDSGQTLTYSIVTQPSHGTVSITNASTGAYTYTPSSGYIGPDSFTFKVYDGYKYSNTATVSASVVDNPPVAQSARYNVTANRYVSGTLKATASNSSQTLTYSIVSKPAHGTVSLDAGTGQFTYIPTHNYTGTDRFTFKASDGTLDSNTATVTLKVAAGALAAHNGTGGGAFGPWGLALLAGLAGLIVLLRRKPSARGSSRGTKTAVLALGLVLAGSVLVTATPARAAEAGPWYAGVQGNVLKAASGRNSATAGFKGWTLLFGRHMGQHFALEINRASYSDHPKTLTATANWVNWGLRGLYFPWKSQGAFAPFVLAGMGHQYEYRGDNSELSNNSASLGLGFTSQPWSAPVAIRADIEVQHGFGGGYTDKIFSLGVVFGFGTSG